MYKMSSRKPTFKSQPSDTLKATHEDFKPEFEWTEDPYNRILVIQMPGFKREEIRVQLDGAGKLLVKGSKQVPFTKYVDVDQSFDVPKDTISEKISGRFEDERLTLIMPKMVVEEQQPAAQKAVTEEKEKEPARDKKEEPAPDEQPKAVGEKTDKEPHEKTDEEKKDEPVTEKPTSHEEKKDEPLSEEKPTTREKVKKDNIIHKMKSKISEICADKQKELTERISKWRGNEDGWLDSESLDNILDKLNQNRKEIAMAAVAFSAGFYVSSKLRRNG